MLLSHVVVAVVSLTFAGYTAMYPSKGKYRFSFLLIVPVLISGVFLAAGSGVAFGKLCLTGIVYLAIVGVLGIITKIRISSLPLTSK